MIMMPVFSFQPPTPRSKKGPARLPPPIFDENAEEEEAVPPTPAAVPPTLAALLAAAPPTAPPVEDPEVVEAVRNLQLAISRRNDRLSGASSSGAEADGK